MQTACLIQNPAVLCGALHGQYTVRPFIAPGTIAATIAATVAPIGCCSADIMNINAQLVHFVTHWHSYSPQRSQRPSRQLFTATNATRIYRVTRSTDYLTQI